MIINKYKILKNSGTTYYESDSEQYCKKSKNFKPQKAHIRERTQISSKLILS